MTGPQYVATINDAISSANDSLDCRESADAAVRWPMIAAVKIKAARIAIMAGSLLN